MKYEKISNIAYNLHLIKTDKFKTINVKIMFKRKACEKELVYRNMLINILMEANHKYQSARLLEIESENLYNIRYGAGSSNSGNYACLHFDTCFLNEKYTEEGMNAKSLEFFFNFIFEPNVINQAFNEETFALAKNLLTDDIKSFGDSPARYSRQKLFQSMVPNTPISYNGYGTLEDLEKVTPSNLYEYYQDILKSDLIDIFVIGDINSEQIKSIIKDKFKIKTIKKTNGSHFLENKKFKSRFSKIKETKELEQTTLLLGYKLEPLTKYEKMYVSYIYSYILGGSPDSKLFKEVREKNSLCYSVSASIYGVSDLMVISSGVNAGDINKAIRLIKEQVKKMSRGEFSDEEIAQAKVTYLASLKGLEDYPGSILNMYISKEYLDYDLLQDRIKSINKITKEDVVNLAKKIHPDTIFVLEGSKKA